MHTVTNFPGFNTKGGLVHSSLVLPVQNVFSSTTVLRGVMLFEPPHPEYVQYYSVQELDFDGYRFQCGLAFYYASYTFQQYTNILADVRCLVSGFLLTWFLHYLCCTFFQGLAVICYTLRPYSKPFPCRVDDALFCGFQFTNISQKYAWQCCSFGCSACAVIMLLRQFCKPESVGAVMPISMSRLS